MESLLWRSAFSVPIITVLKTFDRLSIEHLLPINRRGQMLRCGRLILVLA